MARKETCVMPDVKQTSRPRIKQTTGRRAFFLRSFSVLRIFMTKPGVNGQVIGLVAGTGRGV
jgi:hypothetical protein